MATNGADPAAFAPQVEAAAVTPLARTLGGAGGLRGFLSRMFGSAVSGAAGTAAGTATAGVLVPILQEEVNTVWGRFPNRPLSAEAAAAAVERSALSYGDAEAEAALTGVDARRFKVLELLAGIPPNSEQLIQMVRRGIITTGRMREGLIQGNIRTEWADALIKVTNAVPTISEMVRFATREVYGGGGSGISGTAAEVPGGFITDAKRQGLLEADAIKFWQAHWKLPSPTQLYQMLWRGVIDKGTVAEGLRVSDYPPFWRDKLTEIAYHVPGRIDLRRMLQHGIIDEARVHKGYKDLGYDDETAGILTSFAVELAKPAPSTPSPINWTERGRSMAFSDIHGRFKQGGFNQAEAAAALSGIGIPGEHVGNIMNFWTVADR